MTRTYSVVLLREPDGGYSVSVPTIRGCHTMGDDVPEALANAREALELHLECLAAHGDAIPEEGELVSVRMWDAREASIYRMSVPRGEETAQIGVCM